MIRIRALSCLLVFVGACAGAPVQDTAAPDLSPYAKVKVSSVSSEKFLTENPIFREQEDLSAALRHVTTALHSEVAGSIAAEIDGKILYVNL